MCNGSNITKGKWKGERTPDLRKTFLIGATGNITKNSQNVTEPKTFSAMLDLKTPDNSTPGFCFHNKKEEIKDGEKCKIGYRVENHVGLAPNNSEVSSYLRTYRVVYIIKCW